MPRHDRAYGRWHSKKSGGASKSKRIRSRSNYKERVKRREQESRMPRQGGNTPKPNRPKPQQPKPREPKQ